MSLALSFFAIQCLDSALTTSAVKAKNIFFHSKCAHLIFECSELVVTGLRTYSINLLHKYPCAVINDFYLRVLIGVIFQSATISRATVLGKPNLQGHKSF